MLLHRSHVTLGFYGDDLDPTQLTRLLGLRPTVGVSKGEIWHTTLGAEKVASTGSWRISTEDCEPADLNGQIEGLLGLLTPNIDVWRKLTTQFRGVAFCGLWLNSGNEGLEIAPQTLAALADRGLLLDLDIYGLDDGI